MGRGEDDRLCEQAIFLAANTTTTVLIFLQRFQLLYLWSAIFSKTLRVKTSTFLQNITLPLNAQELSSELFFLGWSCSYWNKTLYNNWNRCSQLITLFLPVFTHFTLSGVSPVLRICVFLPFLYPWSRMVFSGPNSEMKWCLQREREEKKKTFLHLTGHPIPGKVLR